MGALVFECVVSADLFRRAHLGVSTEESRYYLNGVHVSPAPEGGAVITATDGSMLISMHDPDAYVSGECIVRLDKPLLRALSISGVLLERRLLVVRVEEGGKGRAFVVDQPVSADSPEAPATYQLAREALDSPDRRVRAAQFGGVNIDGKFPDWRRVLPDDLNPEGPVPTFDQAKLAKAATAVSTKSAGLKITITPARDNPHNSPFLVTGNGMDAPAGFAIIMPLRHERKGSPSVPAWARPAPSQMAAE